MIFFWLNLILQNFSYLWLSSNSVSGVFYNIEPMTLTIFVGWLITRYCDSQNTYYRIDVITVHFIVWQFMYLMCKWKDRELEWPIFHSSTSILLHFYLYYRISSEWIFSSLFTISIENDFFINMVLVWYVSRRQSFLFYYYQKWTRQIVNIK